MKSILTILLIAIYSVGNGQARPFKSYAAKTDKAIHVEFYKNIEFVGFTFFLGSLGPAFANDHGTLDNGMTRHEWHAYNYSLYDEYKSYRDNADLRAITAVLEVTEGSTLIRLVLQLNDFPNASAEGLEEKYYSPFATDGKNGLSVVTDFIGHLNNFYKAVNFDRYFQKHGKLYDHALGEIVRALPDNRLIPAMEKYYQQSFDRYTIMPSLTIPSGMAFGTGYTARGRTYVFNTFGPYARQQFADEKNINMGFENKEHLRELSTHEFGHSFSNPMVDEIPAGLVKETARLFAPIKEAMENQGYQNWKSCLYEHFVRASEVIIARNLGKQKEAEELKASYIGKRKFIYLEPIIESLEKYNQSQKSITFKMAVMEAMEKIKAIP